MMRSDIDYDDDGFSDEESETDVPLTGGRPTPKWDQFRSVFITRSEVSSHAFQIFATLF